MVDTGQEQTLTVWYQPVVLRLEYASESPSGPTLEFLTQLGGGGLGIWISSTFPSDAATSPRTAF